MSSGLLMVKRELLKWKRKCGVFQHLKQWKLHDCPRVCLRQWAIIKETLHSFACSNHRAVAVPSPLGQRGDCCALCGWAALSLGIQSLGCGDRTRWWEASLSLDCQDAFAACDVVLGFR